MQIKLKLILYIIIVLMIISIIVGCINKNEEIEYIDGMRQSKQNNIKIEKAIKNIKESINKIEIEINKEVDIQEAIQPISLGEFKLTAYCSCELCCGIWAYNRPVDENGNEIVYGAIGERLKTNYSIAVDPSVIPYGTEVIINEHTYKAQDCGGAIKGNRIDVYYDNHQDALEFGVQYAEVFIKSK